MEKYNEVINRYNYLVIENNKTALNKIVNYICKEYSGYELIKLCDFILSSNMNQSIAIVTLCIKKNNNVYQLEYMDYYLKWVQLYVDCWGICDVMCYRITNPMIEKYPILYDQVYHWTKDSNCYIRRLAAVSLIHSSQAFSINVPFSLVENVVNLLKNDQIYYVKKGIGWLLKYSYLSYKKETMNYIIENKKCLDKIVINYSYQKMNEIDKKLIKNIK